MRAKIYDFNIQIRNRMCTHELVQLVWRLRRQSGKEKPPMFFLRWTVDIFDECICFLRILIFFRNILHWTAPAAAVQLHFGPPGTACDRQRSSERSQGEDRFEDRFEISQANTLIFTGLEMRNENQFPFKCKWLVMSESSPTTCKFALPQFSDMPEIGGTRVYSAEI